MIIDILDEEEVLSAEIQAKMKEIVQFASEKEAIAEDTELSVTIVNNESIQQLNKAYRQKDVPTDVLSFPLDDDGPAVEGMPVILGDIIISHEKVEEQANSYGHTLERELCFLLIHGLLHLIGYTHDNEIDEKEMFAKQRAILEEFGIER